MFIEKQYLNQLQLDIVINYRYNGLEVFFFDLLNKLLCEFFRKQCA